MKMNIRQTLLEREMEIEIEIDRERERGKPYTSAHLKFVNEK